MMLADARWVLPPDVVIIPVRELGPEIAPKIDARGDDFAITRPHGRAPSRVLDARFAPLIEQFRTPTKIAAAVFAGSSHNVIAAEQLLDAALPVLMQLVAARFLVPADEPLGPDDDDVLGAGDRILDCTVIDTIRIVDDTALYAVRQACGNMCALKLARRTGAQRMRSTFAREAAALTRLDGRVNPRLLAAGEYDGCPYLLLEWCRGAPVADAAARLRRAGDRQGLRILAVRLLEAFAHLHAQGIVHGDIHPGNILCDREATIAILDYGLAADMAAPPATDARGGVGFFFEPEFVAARGSAGPTQLGEQYALAALIFRIFTGTDYLDFSLERGAVFRQILHEQPRSFEDCGSPPWPAFEAALRRALSKNPSERFASLGQFAQAIESAGIAPPFQVANCSHVNEFACFAAASTASVGFDSPLLQARSIEAPSASLALGAAGIALGCLRMAYTNDDPELLALAELWSAKAAHSAAHPSAFDCAALGITPATVGSISPYHAIAGVHAVCALVAVAGGDRASAQLALTNFIAASRAGSTSLDITSGKAGTLLAAALLNDALSPETDTTALLTLGDATVAQIWSALGSYGPIVAGPGSGSFGVAHGWAGILFATLTWSRAAGRTVPAALRGRLAELAAVSEPLGSGSRWRDAWAARSTANAHRGWCNGSAGFVFMWTSAYAALGDSGWLELAQGAAWSVWEGSNESANLCCGDAGGAYSLLNFYRASGDRNWLHRAEQLARRALATTADSRKIDELSTRSLYKGSLGVAVLAADLAQPDRARMPFFEVDG